MKNINENDFYKIKSVKWTRLLFTLKRVYCILNFINDKINFKINYKINFYYFY